MKSTNLLMELRALQPLLTAPGENGQEARRRLHACTDPVLESMRRQCLGILNSDLWAARDCDALETPGETESRLVAQKDAMLGRLFAAIDHACGMAAIALDCRDEAAAHERDHETASLLIQAITHCEGRYGPFEITIA